MITSIAFSIGLGISFINIHQEKDVYSGMVVEVKDNYYIFQSGLEKFYIYEKETTKEIGDILSITGYCEKTNFTVLESQFDFNNYLSNKGIDYQLNAKNVIIRFQNPLKINALKKSFLNKFDENTKNVINSIFFGRSSDSTIRDNLSGYHLARLMSSSGLYIYAFMWLISFLFSFLMKKKYSDLVSIGVLSLYFVFTFPRFTVIKLFALSIFRWLNNNVFKNKIDYLELLCGLGICFLIIDYHLAYQESFILGFSLPLFIYFLRPILSRKSKLKQKIYLSISIYLFFIPFELKFYNSLSPFSLILQPILTPAFIVFGILALFTFYGLPLHGVLNGYNVILEKITSPLSKASLVINVPPLPDIGVLAYYVILIILVYYITIIFKPIYQWIGIIASCFGILYILPISNLFTNGVYFINVGQGDSCLIRNQGVTILIDTGGSVYNDLATNSLIPFFKKNRIYDIDLLITTHDDYDHSGAVSSLQKHFKVNKYVKSYDMFPIKIGNITLSNYNNHIEESKDDNDKSLVIGFSLSNKNYLIMGDAPTSIESKIMEEYKSIPCDILKVGHHGSDTSSSDSFIKYLSPKEAIISVGKNSYGHPTKSVISILKKNNVLIKRTDELGTISYVSFI